VFTALALASALSFSIQAAEVGERIPKKADRYVYMANIVRVIDGDTVVADIDLGFHTWRRDERLRLARINAPEPRGDTKEAGLAATEWLKNKVEGKRLIIRTAADKSGRDKRGKFGRYLVELYLDGRNLNDEMVQLGLAERTHY
jgi:micrococcal nuclease